MIGPPAQARPFHFWPAGQQPWSGICRSTGQTSMVRGSCSSQRPGISATADAMSSAGSVFCGAPIGMVMRAVLGARHWLARTAARFVRTETEKLAPAPAGMMPSKEHPAAGPTLPQAQPAGAAVISAAPGRSLSSRKEMTPPNWSGPVLRMLTS